MVVDVLTSPHASNGAQCNNTSVLLTQTRICIVGAGAAGLVNLKLLKERPDAFDVDVYEKSSVIGGTWNYTDAVGVDEEGKEIHSSMYENLLTNIPMCIMQFSDFICQPEKAGFIHHSFVLQYLRDYADHYNLTSLIKFRHHVLDIVRVMDKWRVTVLDIVGGIEKEEHFDAVIICNGRYSKPRIPSLPGKESFRGRIIHSHDYRKPENFRGERVCVIGAGPSGTDIALELSEVAEEVFLCHSQTKLFPKMRGVKQVNSRIGCLEGSKVIMESGDTLKDITTLLLCTGYEYDFSFLDKSCNIRVNEGRVLDVYLHLINAHHPTMAIFAIPFAILPFPLYEQQAKFFMKYLLRDFELPSTTEMIADSEADYQDRLSRGIPYRHSHRMSTREMLFQYEKRIASIAKFDPLPPVVEDLFGQLKIFREEFTDEYKKWQFRILNDDEYICSKNDE